MSRHNQQQSSTASSMQDSVKHAQSSLKVALQRRQAAVEAGSKQRGLRPYQSPLLSQVLVKRRSLHWQRAAPCKMPTR